MSWQGMIHWLLGGISLLYVFSRFVPCGPTTYYADIEGSWIQALHVAFSEHWQFGREIIFTYGPWGFLYGGFDPATQLVSVMAWTILSVIFWYAVWRSARLCFNNDLFAWLWLMIFCAVAGLTISMNMDVRLLAWVLLLLLLHFFLENRSFSPAQFLLVVSLGLLSLVKFSIFMTGGMAVLVIAADNVWRQRSFPWIVVVFGASLAFFWAAAGQHFNSLLIFFINSWRMTSGYTEAMSLSRTTETRDTCLFLAALAMLGVMVAYASWKRLRVVGILPVVGLGFVGFTMFKSGYVRQDKHEAWAVIQLLLGALACQAIVWPLVRKKAQWIRLSTFVPMLLIFLFASSTFARYSESRLATVMAQTFSMRNLLAPFRLLPDWKRLPEAHQEYLALLRNKFPAPQFQGTVDAYPWNQCAISSVPGQPYHPRPVFQSYSAYTPELAELNASHLRSADAPDNLLFNITAIDNHYPMMDDGLSWPEMLTRYDVKTNNGTFLLLTRSAAPRAYQKILIKDAALAFGKPLILSGLSNSPIWAEIEINKTLPGTVISTLYKPPALSLKVSLRDGRQGEFRLVPGMARSGFLLSPYIYNNELFIVLAAGAGPNELTNLEVTSLSVSAANESGETTCYQSLVCVRLYRLDYPRQDMSLVTPTAP
ncbi:MAG: hypothetical protein WDM80_13525 [Limisphaerales bacterium]